MHYFITTLLIASLPPSISMASEALNNTKLANTYISEARACKPGKDKKPPKGCTPPSRSHAIINKALRDAEQQQNLLHYLETRQNQPAP